MILSEFNLIHKVSTQQLHTVAYTHQLLKQTLATLRKRMTSYYCQFIGKELNEKVNQTCDGDTEDSLTWDVKYYCKYDVNVNSSDWCLPICYYQSRDSSTVCCEGRDPLCTVENEMCAITAPGTQPGQYVCRYG